MHPVKLLLENRDLLFERLLPVQPFIGLRLRLLRICADPGHLDKLIDGLLHQPVALRNTVCRQDCILLLVGNAQLIRQSYAHFLQAFPSKHIIPGYDSPLKTIHKLKQRSLRPLKGLFPALLIHIYNVRAKRSRCIPSAILIFCHFHIYTVFGLHTDSSVAIHLCDCAHQADRIEILRRCLLCLFLLLHNQKKDLFLRCRLLLRHLLYVILLKIIMNLRRHQKAGDRQYHHKPYSSHISSAISCSRFRILKYSSESCSPSLSNKPQYIFSEFSYRRVI